MSPAPVHHRYLDLRLARSQVAFHSTSGSIAVDNTVNGFEVFNIEKPQKLTHLPTKTVKSPLPRQVAFSNDGKIVVGGSDTGMAHIFSSSSGKALQSLKLKNQELVQTVTVSMPWL